MYSIDCRPIGGIIGAEVEGEQADGNPSRSRTMKRTVAGNMKTAKGRYDRIVVKVMAKDPVMLGTEGRRRAFKAMAGAYRAFNAINGPMRLLRPVAEGEEFLTLERQSEG
jgi:hypothetical protein